MGGACVCVRVCEGGWGGSEQRREGGGGCCTHPTTYAATWVLHPPNHTHPHTWAPPSPPLGGCCPSRRDVGAAPTDTIPPSHPHTRRDVGAAPTDTSPPHAHTHADVGAAPIPTPTPTHPPGLHHVCLRGGGCRQRGGQHALGFSNVPTAAGAGRGGGLHALPRELALAQEAIGGDDALRGGWVGWGGVGGWGGEGVRGGVRAWGRAGAHSGMQALG